MSNLNNQIIENTFPYENNDKKKIDFDNFETKEDLENDNDQITLNNINYNNIKNENDENEKSNTSFSSFFPLNEINLLFNLDFNDVNDEFKNNSRLTFEMKMNKKDFYFEKKNLNFSFEKKYNNEFFLNKSFLNDKQSNSNLKFDDDDLSNFDPKENLNQIINCFNMINKKEFSINSNEIGNNKKYGFFKNYNKELDDNNEKRNIEKFINEENIYEFNKRKNKFFSSNFFEYKFTKNKINKLNFLHIKKRKFPENLLPEVENYINNCPKNKYVIIESKIKKIGDIEDISSILYKYQLYNNNEQIILKIISSFLTYRFVLNDGYSFFRVFAFSLLEYYIFNESNETLFLLNDFFFFFYKEISNFENIINFFREIHSSIDDLKKAFNDEKLGIDKAFIIYLRKIISFYINIDLNDYYEIDKNILQIICDIFGVNLFIIYLDGNKEHMTFNNIKIKSKNYENITFIIGYFFHSYHLIYSNEDFCIPTEFLDKNIKKESYIIKNIKNIQCPLCNEKNIELVLLTLYNKVFCYKCLNEYCLNILTNRAINFFNNNFTDLEYYLRNIIIKNEIQISSIEYNLIYNKSFIEEIISYMKKMCFICKKKFNKVIKLKCKCHFCQKCLENYIKNATNNKFLNEYEIKLLPKINCICKLPFNIIEALQYSKNIKYNEKEEKKEKKEGIIKMICCICGEKNDDLLILEVKDDIEHKICKGCLNLQKNKIEDIGKFNDNEYKFLCVICGDEHIVNLENNITNVSSETHQSNIIENNYDLKKKRKEEVSCSDKCNIM